MGTLKLIVSCDLGGLPMVCLFAEDWRTMINQLVYRILETFHIAFCIMFVYVYLITHFNDPAYLATNIHW